MSGNKKTRVFSGAPWESRVGYCRAVRTGGFIAVSGTAPVLSSGGIASPGDAYAQAKLCFEIIVRALRELGGSPSDVARTRMYTTDISRWAEIGRAHREIFGEDP